MSHNDEVLREEFQAQVTEAYNGVSLNAVAKAEYKQKILAKAKRKSARNKYFKVAAVIAACLVFVVANIAIITLNMKHGRPAEEVTGDGETMKSYEYVNELLEVQAGDVIHSLEVSVGDYKKFADGADYNHIANYTVQVVLEEIVAGNTPEIDAKINNKEKVTGIFVLRVVDKEGVVKSRMNLSSGAVSEYGLSLPLNEEDLSEQFVVYEDMVAFRHLMREENGRQEYLTTFYGVDTSGNLFHYELNEDGLWNDRYISRYDMVTSGDFEVAFDAPGTYRDCVVTAEGAILMHYGFDVDTGKISVYMACSGVTDGPVIEAARRFLEGKCATEKYNLQEIFLAEVVEEVSSNGYYVYALISNYSDVKLMRVYVLQLGDDYVAQTVEEIEIPSLKTSIISDRGEDKLGTFEFWAQQFITDSEFKVSSPWPESEKLDYKIVNYDEDTVDILFYAWASGPYVSVFKNTIEYNMSTDAKSMFKVSENLTYYDAIDSAQEFFEAYPEGIINGTRMDYLTNGYGLALNENALKERIHGDYNKLFDPETAVATLLNIDLLADNINVFAVNDTSSTSIDVCIEFEKTGRRAYVRMIKPFGGDGIWIPQTADMVYSYGVPEDIVNVLEADVDNDGAKDYIVTSITDSNDSDSISESRNMEADFSRSAELCYVRIYSGNGKSQYGEFCDEDCIWWKEFAHARPGNGFVVLVEDEGKNYLLTGMLNEQQGTGNYSYVVANIGDLNNYYVDEGRADFITAELSEEHLKSLTSTAKRNDVVPEFRANIEKWFNNAALVVAFDIGSKKEAFISTKEHTYVPEDYFDAVWERTDYYTN